MNPIKDALRQGRPVLGGWLQTATPVAAEILSAAGFEFLAVDMEHTELSQADLAGHVRAMQAAGNALPLVRVRENDTLAIRQSLDNGACGVIVPLVDSADAARLAVEAALYPPEGIRGFAYVQANQWGRRFPEYAAAANQDILVIVMIESRLAVEQIDAIAAVHGVDGVLIGPYDLSGSYGIPGQTGSPVIHEACRQVVRACRQAGKAAGMHIVRPDAAAIRQAIADGFTFLPLGMDTVFLKDGADQALRIARSALTSVDSPAND